MLGKLLKKKSVTDNVGNISSPEAKTSDFTTVTYITVEGTSGPIRAELIKKVTIGSEVGDLIVAEAGVSPRHCTFFLSNNVISLMDHSSEQGTFLNKKRLDSGKVFIINDNDKIKIGKLSIIIEVEQIHDDPVVGESEEEDIEELTDLEVEEDLEDDENHFEDLTTPISLSQLAAESDLTAETRISEEFVEDDSADGPVIEKFKELALKKEEDEEAGEEEAEEEADTGIDAMGLTELRNFVSEDVESQKTIVAKKLPGLSKTKPNEEEVEIDSLDDLEIEELEEEDTDKNGTENYDDIEDLDLEEDVESKSEVVDNKKPKKGLFSFFKRKEKEVKLVVEKPSRVDKKNLVKNKTEKPKKAKLRKDPSSGILTRIISNFNDVAICFIILEVFSVYTEFNIFYESVPSDFWSIFSGMYNSEVLPLYQGLSADYPEVKNIVDGLLDSEYSEKILRFSFLFFFVKAIPGMIFTISLGEFFAGMRVEGPRLVRRLVYPVRLFIGILLFPFLIFDFPTVLSKRSFKEVITGTQYKTRSGLLTIGSMLIMTPLLVLLFFLAPLFKGMEVLPTITVNEKLNRVKNWKYTHPVYIKSTDISYDRLPGVEILPSMSLTMKDKKNILNIGTLFINTNNGSVLKIQKLKTFSFIEVYRAFVKLNIGSQYFQPEIHSLVKNVAVKNKNFKFNIKNKNALVDETGKLIKDSFGIELMTLPTFLVENGFLMSGFRDFREKIENLYPEKINKLTLTKIGSKRGLLGEHGSGKSKYYTFIPLGDVNGVMYKINGDLLSVKNKGLNQNLVFGQIDKKQAIGINIDSEGAILAYIDRSHDSLVENQPELNQAVYEKYFEVTKTLISSGNTNAILKLKMELERFLNILSTKQGKNQKLYGNLSELLEAMKGMNYEFFSLTKTETV